ncbi:MAG: THUMP domain-containing class I SAM-dependent RNA methyltransferase [Fusobacteriaceae bacterium]
MTIIASASMGIEGIVKDECKTLGFENVNTFNGRVEFDGEYLDIARANIHLRCADRVYLKMGEFKAMSYEELFQATYALPWEDIIPVDGEFPISWVSAVDCKLYSKSDIQKIVKKAIVEKLKSKFRCVFFSEKGAKYAVKIQGSKDNFILMIDTSGEALHRRGYRYLTNEAPIKETMAAAMIYLSRWKGGELPLLDPMCGTGTIAIEAAMIARKIAPGTDRNFASEGWSILTQSQWLDMRDEAMSGEDHEKMVKIYASDIDAETLEVAKKNANIAGVDGDIQFDCANMLTLESPEKKGAIITNPPYGDRLSDEEGVQRLYTLMGDLFRMRFPKWSVYVITSYEEFQEYYGKKSTKNRKLYNGGIKCYFYQYHGER